MPDRSPHEVGMSARTNMTTITGFAHLLSQPGLNLPAEKRVEYAVCISNACEALARDIDEALFVLTRD